MIKRTSSRAFWYLLVAGCVAGLWYLLAYLLVASHDPLATSKLPYPHLIVQRVVEFWPTIASATWATLSRALLGFAVGGAIGVVFAVVLAQARWVEVSVMPYILVAQMIPMLALVPIIQAITRRDDLTRLAIAALITFFSVVLATLRGLKTPNRLAWDLLGSYGAGRLKGLRYLQFPSSLPFLFSGLKIAAPLSLVGAVIVDLLGANTGLGFLMLSALTFGPEQATMLWVAMLVTLLLGLLLARAVTTVERMVSPWQLAFRSEVRQ
jgi:NitT/TauT family transport system permease protein